MKMKETLLEKRLQDVEGQLMDEIRGLQEQLETEKQDHEDDVRELRLQYDKMMQVEQKKHNQRISTLQERLSAKDVAYDELQKMHVSCDNGDMDDLELLRNELAKEKTERERERAQWDEERATHAMELETLKIELSTSSTGTDGNAISGSEIFRKENQQYRRQLELVEQDQQRHRAHVAELESRLKTAEDQLKNAEDGKRQKIVQLTENFDSEMERLKELFFNEGREMAMHNEAKIQNLQAEYDEILLETKERFETEKAVWQIEHQSTLDKIGREFRKEKEYAVARLEREWREKIQDIQASMSQDSSDVQAHWEKKLEEAQEAGNIELKRLQGELAVIKDRLGKEIERRHGVQGTLAVLEKQIRDDVAELVVYEHETKVLKKHKQTLQNQVDVLRHDFQTACHLARNLLSISASEDSDVFQHQTSLVDLLHASIRHVTSLYVRQGVMEQTMTSQLMLNSHPYGY
ncbi:hypothetical protein DFQ30_005692 [Apophysomyces sp. BC1015]|nr:hypothetical protein DFQ30_005692 [Apophysomyces sp. BC1015]